MPAHGLQFPCGGHLFLYLVFISYSPDNCNISSSSSVPPFFSQFPALPFRNYPICAMMNGDEFYRYKEVILKELFNHVP
jgi:hypothetical protein